MYSTQAHVDELAAIWANNISDPPPEPNIFNNWLEHYGYQTMTHAVNTTVRRYRRGGIDYNGCIRYCASVARSNKERDEVPAAWLTQPV